MYIIISDRYNGSVFSSPCVFSPGAYINNRSLMPCQEPPLAMATWQAFIQVPNGAKVLMSGDKVTCKEQLLKMSHDDNGEN